jgi:predicted ATPase with chaperone activity
VQTLMDHPMQGDASEALNGFLRESGGMRSTHRVARVAWTLADLEGCDAPRIRHVREAIELHQPMWDEAT